MEAEPSKSKNSSYWIVLFIALLFVVVAFIFYQQEEKPAKEIEETFPSHNRWEQHDNNKRRNELANRRDNSGEEERQFDPHQEFIEKGYSKKDIKELTNWDLEASEVPDLKAEKRRGVVNTLSVVDEYDKEGSCSELVIILKKSPHVKVNSLNIDEKGIPNNGLSSMKINQSQEFADTKDSNKEVIKFAIRKIVEKGHTWEWDVYVLKANNNAGTISGGSAGSGVYLTLLSAFYSDTIPKNLAITGAFKTEGEEISTKIESHLIKIPMASRPLCPMQ